MTRKYTQWFDFPPKYETLGATQRDYLKYCVHCGGPMFMRWKTAKYCSSKCQTEKAKKIYENRNN